MVLLDMLAPRSSLAQPSWMILLDMLAPSMLEQTLQDNPPL
jgi:hypothetical protein